MRRYLRSRTFANRRYLKSSANTMTSVEAFAMLTQNLALLVKLHDEDMDNSYSASHAQHVADMCTEYLMSLKDTGSDTRIEEVLNNVGVKFYVDTMINREAFDDPRCWSYLYDAVRDACDTIGYTYK